MVKLSTNQKIIIILTAIMAIAAVIGVIINYYGTSTTIINSPPPEHDFILSVDPIHGVVQQGNSTQLTVKVEQSKEYSYQVSLTASEQPAGIAITFDNPVGIPTPSFSSNVDIVVSSNASVGSYTITIKASGASENKEHFSNYRLTVTPGTDPVSETPA